ncbi:MAG: hypothetical protein MJZ34_01420, partial [Paludibacteraceae bacterium]|nr:hypothetical protein [Paludibacteraceae bacterium]
MSDSMFFQLNVVPSIVLTPLQDTTVCIGSSVKNIHSDCIKGNPTSYLWTYDASSGSNTSTGSSLSVLKIANDFDITLQVKNDVCTSNTVSMKILVEDSIKFTLDADHLTLCPNEEVTLKTSVTSGDVSSYQWSINDVPTHSGMTELKDVPTTNSTYKLEIAGNKCPSISQEVFVEASPKIELELSTPNPIVCSDNVPTDILLNPSSNVSAPYSVEGSVDGIDFQDNVNFNDNPSSVYYRLKSRAFDHCPWVYSDTVRIDIEPVLTPAIQPVNSYVCEGESIALEAVDNLSSYHSFAWVKNDKDTLSKSDLALTDIVTEFSKYKFVVSGKACPEVADSAYVGIYMTLPVADPDPIYVCEGESVALEDYLINTFSDFYAWVKNGTDTISRGSRSLTVTPTESCKYECVVKGQCYLEMVETIEIIVEHKATPIIQKIPTLVCEGTTLSFEGNDVGSVSNTFAWVKNGTDTLSKNNTSFMDTPTETSTYEYVIFGQYCPKVSESVVVEVEPKVMPTIQPVSGLICEGTPLSLMGEAAIGKHNSIAWIRNGSDTISKASNSLSEIPTETNTYEFVVLGESCPTTSSSVTIEVEPKVNPTIQDYPNLICMGTSVSLVGEAAVGPHNSVAWVRNSTDTMAVNEMTLTEIPTETSNYEFVVLGESCPSVSKSVTIEVELRAMGNIHPAPHLLCEGSSITLEGVADVLGVYNSYAWVKNTTDTISKGELIMTDFPEETTTYEFVVLGKVCLPEATKHIVEIEPKVPVSILPVPTLICEGTTVSLEAEANVTARNQYAWVKNATDTISRGEKTLTEVPTGTNTYEFVVLSENCPKVSDAITIEVEPKVTATIQEVPTLICEGASVALTGETTIGTHNRVAWVKNATDTISKGENTLTDVPTGVNTYEFVVMGESCPNVSDAITIETETTINPQIKSFPTLICEGTTVSLEAEANVTA